MKRVLILMVILTFLVACGKNDSEEYRLNLQGLSDDILDNATDVEKILNEYSSVWKFSIENSSAITVDEMAERMGFSQEKIKEVFEINSAGNVPNDFSTNVHSLKTYYESNDEIAEVKERSELIKEGISNLNGPPKGYDKAYDEVLDMYDLSEKFTEMVLNPSGSLQIFNEDKNQLSSDILSKHKRIKVVLPNE